MDDCSCGIAAILEKRSADLWSSRGKNVTQQSLSSVHGRMVLTPSTLPARHSKSLDQLGPEVIPAQIPTPSKTLPRSASTQLISRHRAALQNGTLPATVPSSRSRHPSTVQHSGLFFPTSTSSSSRQQACSAPNPSLGLTPVATLPRAKSTQILAAHRAGQQQQQHNSGNTKKQY